MGKKNGRKMRGCARGVVSGWLLAIDGADYLEGITPPGVALLGTKCGRYRSGITGISLLGFVYGLFSRSSPK